MLRGHRHSAPSIGSLEYLAESSRFGSQAVFSLGAICVLITHRPFHPTNPGLSLFTKPISTSCSLTAQEPRKSHCKFRDIVRRRAISPGSPPHFCGKGHGRGAG